MKKFFVMTMLAFFFGGLSLKVLAQTITGQCTIAPFSIGYNTTDVLITDTIYGATFIGAGDSLRFSCDVFNVTDNVPMGTQNLYSASPITDSISTGMIFTVQNLIQGKQFKLTLHMVYHKNGAAFWFTNGNFIFVTQNCFPFTVSVTGGTTICAGQSADLTASGADSYVWSNGATTSLITVSPIVTTTYTVVGTIGACSVNNSATVTIGGSMTSTISGSTTICNGNSSQLVATGGNNYTWSPANSLSCINCSNPIATPTNTTTYTVTISNSFCSDVKSVTITVNQNPVVAVTPSTTICLGSSIVLSASGADTYLWSPASSLSSSVGSAVIAMPTTTTNYGVTGYIGNCAMTNFVLINVVDTPTVNSVVFNGGTLVLHGDFHSKILVIYINGVPYYPSLSSTLLQAVFYGVTISPGNIIIVQTVSAECLTSIIYSITGIEEIQMNSETYKNLPVFNLLGQKVEVLTPYVLYIKRGKKFMITQ